MKENYIDIHTNNKKQIFCQGIQSNETRKRYDLINEKLLSGYLEDKINYCESKDLSELSQESKILLENITNSVTSELGRALVGLTFLQIVIKDICPEQCIRLHKGCSNKGHFSGVDWSSMRAIDSNFITPFLRKYGLLKLNSYDLLMTRSIAENYPYSTLYNAEIQGPFNDWMLIVDAIEDKSLNADLAIDYIVSLLKNK
ncbi:MAG: hypothetical protein IJU76_00635 [Desulfovibrionaceae bacterium]|nr:hypothetical protein [Desulfovibrionaceae bacterium]